MVCIAVVRKSRYIHNFDILSKIPTWLTIFHLIVVQVSKSFDVEYSSSAFERSYISL